MKIKASTRLVASWDSRVFYRGITQAWSEEHAKKQHIIFVTPDYDYALEYAKDKDHVLEFHVDLGTIFNLGFRSLQTEVKFEDLVSRVRKGVMDQFGAHKISKDQGLKLVNDLRALSGSGMKHVWEWYMSVPDLVHILKAAGFDSLEGAEGNNDDIPTYGLFSASQLKRT